jgi:hypothetical protein
MVYSYPYNWSNNSGVDGYGSFMQYVKSGANNTLATGILVIIWLATFLMSLGSGARRAFIASGFVGCIFSIWFARLSMINPMIVIIFIVMIIVGLIMNDEAFL